eukprot:5144456-Amphidinium_carterae.1
MNERLSHMDAAWVNYRNGSSTCHTLQTDIMEAGPWLSQLPPLSFPYSREPDKRWQEKWMT